MQCGTVPCNAHWYRSSAGDHRCASVGVLWHARRAKYGSCPEHSAWMRSPLTIFMAASAWPLLLGFLGTLVLWSNFVSYANSAKSTFANCGPLSVYRDSGIPCSANNSVIRYCLCNIALGCRDSVNDWQLGSSHQ